VYAVVAGSLVIDLLGSLLTQAHGIERLSLFHYLPADPSHRVDFARLAGTTAVGAALCVLAMVLFARRDQATG
jgi:putative exporter of polyketide antibiotics